MAPCPLPLSPRDPDVWLLLRELLVAVEEDPVRSSSSNVVSSSSLSIGDGSICSIDAKVSCEP